MEPLKGIALESGAGQVQHCSRSGRPEMPLFDKSEVFMQVQSQELEISLNASNKYYKCYHKSLRAGLIVLLGLHARGNDTVS